MSQHEGHSHGEGHNHSGHHEHQRPKWKPHKDWRFWAVVLMLAAMIGYVMTLDLSFIPGLKPGARMPADAPAAP